MKKLLCCLTLLLCALLLTGCAKEEPAPAPEATPAPTPVPTLAPGSYTSGAYAFTVREDGTAEITKYNAGEATEVIVPATLENAPVTRIGDSAFAECAALTAITLPEGLREIGNEAFFACSALTSINLPDTLTAFDSNPFTNCEALTDIRLSAGHPCFEMIDGVLFSKADRSLICYPRALIATSYTVPEGTCFIGHSAFYSCKALEEITLPAGLEVIGDFAFANSRIEEIVIPEGVTAIGSYAFLVCSQLRRVELPESLQEIGEHAFTATASVQSDRAYYVPRNSYALQFVQENDFSYYWSR